ncbi:MAG: hypothetical protein CMN78_03155 [Spirochaetales bacterium]|nr:hypothetical protein [Spirochaetales bacterium]
MQKVESKRQQRIFLTFPWRIYKDDPLWVPPLLPQRKKTISPQRGVFFRRGSADFFVAYYDGKPAGTICAAVDPPGNAQRGVADCVIGFFECVNRYEVAKALFDRAALWANDQGLESLFGPFNLDYEDGYGVLVKGHPTPAALMCGHTKDYYQAFFEEYGFVKARGDSLAFRITLDPNCDRQRRLGRLAEVVKKRSKLRIRSANLDQFEQELDRIHELLVKSLVHLPGSIPWRRDVLGEFLLPFRKIVDPDLILFVESEGKTVGWYPGIPNLNEVFIKVNGLRHPWNYVQLLLNIKKQPKCITTKSILVLPEFWQTGAGILLFDEMRKRAYARGYKMVDLSLTAEDNPQTPLIATRVGAEEYKRYRTYRKSIQL